MKEVTFKNVKCKTGGLIPRKGDARYERYPNIEMTVEINNKSKYIIIKKKFTLKTTNIFQNILVIVTKSSKKSR